MKNLKSNTHSLRFTLCWLLFLPALIAHGQFKELEPAKLKAVYTLEWQEDSLNPFRKRQERFVLQPGINQSLFVSYGTLFIDSFARSNTGMTVMELHQSFRQLEQPRRVHQFQIHKNFRTQQMTIFDRIFADLFVYTIPKERIQWRLTEETGEILGYSVQKATTQFGGRTWEAWFTHEIPYGDGPYKFSGLPGLILKVSDTRRHYVFEVQTIVPTNEMIIMRTNSEAIPTTLARFLEARIKFRQEGASAIIASGVPLHPSFHMHTQQITENMRRMNNPILLRAE